MLQGPILKYFYALAVVLNVHEWSILSCYTLQHCVAVRATSFPVS